MILSEDRQTHIAHVIVDGIWNDDLVEYPNEDEAIREAKRVVIEYVRHETSVDEAVRSEIGEYEGKRSPGRNQGVRRPLQKILRRRTGQRKAQLALHFSHRSDHTQTLIPRPTLSSNT